MQNIREATSDLDVRQVRALRGGSRSCSAADADWAAVRDRLARVFGAANFARAGRAPLDVDAIAAEILRDLEPENPRSFRVSVRRADKRFPMTSPQIEREVGGRIKEARGWHVDLDDAELTIHVETLTNEAFYFFGKDPGAGGLPVGVERPRRLPAVGRHRFAGGGVADDAPRLPGALRPLPQLSRSCRARRRRRRASSCGC